MKRGESLDSAERASGATRHYSMPDRSCALCGRGAADSHHVVYRSSLGPDDASNRLDLCRACHDFEHRHIIRIDQDSFARGVLHVIEVASGDVLIERVYTDEPRRNEPAACIAEAKELIWQAAECGLQRDSLEELKCALDEYSSIAFWPIEAEAIVRAYRGWLLWSDDRIETRKTYKLNAIAKAFNLSPSRARQLYEVCTAFPVEDGRFAAYVLSMPVREYTVWRACAGQESPVLALAAVCDAAAASENVSTEMLESVAEQRQPREWWIKTPGSDEWYLMKDCERERREKVMV